MKTIFSKIPLALSLFIFLIFSYAFYFIHAQVKEKNVLAEDTNLKWQEEVNKLEEAKMLDRGIKAVSRESSTVDTHFGKNSDLVPFLDTIEELASLVGAKAETTSVEISPDKQTLLVGLKADGTFESLYKFLTLLENSPYRLEFTSTQFLLSSSQAGSSPMWKAVFMIKLVSFVN